MPIIVVPGTLSRLLSTTLVDHTIRGEIWSHSLNPLEPFESDVSDESTSGPLLPLTYPGFHHELYASKRGNVLCRIAVERGKIGQEAGLDRADAVVHA